MPLRILTGLFLLTTLTLAGCGTRSIVVPVRRPAAIDLHNCDRIAVARIPFAPQPDSLTLLLLRSLEASLAPALVESAPTRFVSSPHGAQHLLTPQGTIALGEAAALARAADATCILLCELLQTAYSEQVLEAEIKSSQHPGKTKFVRQGRATALCRIMLIDVAAGSIPFVENMTVETRLETHAVGKDPPPLARSRFADDITRQITGDLLAATQPVTDRELVTFLVDSDYPLIETAIVHAEEGRWQESTELLRRLIDEDTVGENTDILWYDLGLSLQYQQDFSGALNAFRQALALRQRSRYQHAIDNLLRAEQEFLDTLERQ